MQAVFVEEVSLPEIAEEEFGMSDTQYNRLFQRVDALQKDLSKIDRTVEKLAENAVPLATSIATIDTRLGGMEKHFNKYLIAAFLWLAAITTYGIKLISDVSGLQNGGSYHATEQALQEAKTPEEASANLSLLVAQIQKRASVGKPLNQAQLDSVALTVRDATKSFPDLPKAWDVAASIIDARFSVNRSSVPDNLPNCLDTLKPGDERDRFTSPDGSRSESAGYMDAPPQIPWRAHAMVKDCVLDLDASSNFESSSVGRFFADEKKHHPNTVALFIEATHAKVVYSGGPMLPVSGFHFVDCTFELHQAGDVPPPKGQQFTTHLLTADLSDDTVNLAG